MSYEVIASKRVIKSILKCPKWIQKKFTELVLDLENTGPMQPKWINFSKLSKDKYHCHLGLSWVTCWKHEKNEIIIEVYYVGSREKAPY